MTGEFKIFLQTWAQRFGYQIRRMDDGVSLEDPLAEQWRLAGDCRVVFEVGAADGRDCELYRQQFPQADVYAFEPLPSNFRKLAERSKADPRIHAFNLALSDAPGQEPFFVAEWDDASSLLRAKETGANFDAYQKTKGKINVEVDTLDRIVERQNIEMIDLLKMDAQGAELMILQGASKTLKRKAISIIYTEIHFNPSYEAAARFDQLMTFLYDNGFVLHNLYGLNHDHKGQLFWGDAIFKRAAAV